MVQRATAGMLPIGGDPRIEKVLMKKLIFLTKKEGKEGENKRKDTTTPCVHRKLSCVCIPARSRDRVHNLNRATSTTSTSVEAVIHIGSVVSSERDCVLNQSPCDA